VTRAQTLLVAFAALAGAGAGVALSREPASVVSVSVAARTPYRTEGDPTYGHCTLWRFEDRTRFRTGFLARCGGESHAALLSASTGDFA
jgi:hypothetical protein